jgi:hypothetical protein
LVAAPERLIEVLVPQEGLVVAAAAALHLAAIHQERAAPPLGVKDPLAELQIIMAVLILDYGHPAEGELKSLELLGARVQLAGQEELAPLPELG